MNRTTRSNDLYTYHTIKNLEFSGVLDRFKIYGYIGNYGNPEIFTPCVSNIYVYHLFIRNGNKIYMDIKGIGDIVIPFSELQKNKHWKHYYDLALMLTNDKHLVIQDLQFDSNYYDRNIYFEKRYWCINTAYIEGDYDTKSKNKKVLENEYNCYYRINPYELQNKRYATQKEIDAFTRIYMSQHQVRTGIFNKKSIHYYNIVIEYTISLMEKELEEISAFFEDKKNVLNLATLSDKDGMNSDIIRVIYNFLVSPSSASAHNKYKGIIDRLEHYKNKLEINTIILEA